jgi:transcriptional regulator with XRE-family HTH domain
MTIMSPGTYIRLRRQADGLTIDDLALMIGTVPADKHIARAEWIATIEQDILPVSLSSALALANELSIDLDVLGQLVEAHAHRPADVPPICRACGCTDDRACRNGCSWVESDLCSACASEAKAA